MSTLLLGGERMPLSVNRFLIFLSVVNVSVIIFSGYFFGVETALKGSYSLIGIFLAYYLLHNTMDDQESTPGSSKYSKLAVSLILLSVGGIAITEYNFAISAFAFGSVSVLLILNLNRSIISHRIWILLLVSSSILGPIGKVYSSRLYYGSTDIFVHLGIIREITKAQNILTSSGNYKFFPGYHLTITVVKLSTGLDSYYALIFVGVITFISGIFGIIFLTNIVFQNNYDLSLAAALGYCSLPVVFSYHSYFTTHPFGTTLSIYFIICMFRRKSYRFLLIFLLVVAAVTISHHLSLLIVVVFLYFGAVLELGSYKVVDSTQRALFTQKRTLYLLIVGTIPLAYWSFIGESFIVRLLVSAKNASRLIISESSESSADVVTLGNVQPEILNQSIINFILNTETINVTLILCLFLVGLAMMLTKIYNHRVVAILPLSVMFIPFLLKLPIEIPQQPRLQMVGSVFVSIVIGVGIYSIPRDKSKRKVIVKIILIFLLCTTALAQGSYGTQYLLTESNSNGGSFSSPEYEHLTQSREFSHYYNEDVASLYIEYRYFGSYDHIIEWVGADEKGIEVDSKLLLVRESWSSQLLFSSGSGLGVKNQLYISKNWLNSATNTESVVYDNGDNKYVYMEDTQDFNNKLN